MKKERAGQGEGIKMQGNTELIIITLNVNGMNSPIKWKRLSEWIRNQNVGEYTGVNHDSECEWDELTIKWKQIAEWIRNQNPTICCLQETHMRQVDTYKIKIKGWSKIFWVRMRKRRQEWQS